MKSEGDHRLSLRFHLAPFQTGGTFSTYLLGGEGAEDHRQLLGNLSRRSIFVETPRRLLESIRAGGSYSAYEIAKHLPLLFASIRGMPVIEAMFGRQVLARMKELPVYLTLKELQREAGQEENYESVYQAVEGFIETRTRMFQSREDAAAIRNPVNALLIRLGLDPIPESEPFINSVTLSRYLVRPIEQGLNSGRLRRSSDGGRLEKSSGYDVKDKGIAVSHLIPIQQMAELLRSEIRSSGIERAMRTAGLLNGLDRHFIHRLDRIAYMGRFIFARAEVELADRALVFDTLIDPASDRFLTAYLSGDADAKPETIQSALERYYPINLVATEKIDAVARLLTEGLGEEASENPVVIQGIPFSQGLPQVTGLLVNKIQDDASPFERFILLKDRVTDEDIARTAKDNRIVGFIQTPGGIGNTSSHYTLSLKRLGVPRTGLPPSTSISQNAIGFPLGFIISVFGRYGPFELVRGVPVAPVREMDHQILVNQNSILTLRPNGRIELAGDSQSFREVFRLVNRMEATGKTEEFPADVRLEAMERQYFVRRIIASERLAQAQKTILLKGFDITDEEFTSHAKSLSEEVMAWLGSAAVRIKVSDFPKEIIYLFAESQAKARKLLELIRVAKAIGIDEAGAIGAFLSGQWTAIQKDTAERWQALESRALKRLSSRSFSLRRPLNALRRSALKRTLERARYFGFDRKDSPHRRLFEARRKRYKRSVQVRERLFADSLVLPMRRAFDVPELMGGKGRLLGEADAHKHSSRQPKQIPGEFVSGIVITSQVYKRLIQYQAQPASLSLGDRIRKILGQLDIPPGEKHRRIEELIRKVPIRSAFSGASLIQAIFEHMEPAHKLRYAVRSAGKHEGEAVVPPGTHHTELGVPRQAILKSIKRVTASNWTAQAIVNRERGGEDPFGDFMSVLVQPMVSAEVSGVIAISGNEVIINAAYGLKGGVSEHADADLAAMFHETDFRDVQIGRKEKKWIINPNESGLLLVDVPEAERKREALGRGELTFLYQLASYWQRFFRHPLAIEFAVDPKGAFFITDIKHLAMPWDEMKSEQIEFTLKENQMIPTLFLEGPLSLFQNRSEAREGAKSKDHRAEGREHSARTEPRDLFRELLPEWTARRVVDLYAEKNGKLQTIREELSRSAYRALERFAFGREVIADETSSGAVERPSPRTLALLSEVSGSGFPGARFPEQFSSAGDFVLDLAFFPGDYRRERAEAFLEKLIRSGIRVALTYDLEHPRQTKLASELTRLLPGIQAIGYRENGLSQTRLNRVFGLRDPFLLLPLGTAFEFSERSDWRTRGAVWSSTGRALGRTAPRGWRGVRANPHWMTASSIDFESFVRLAEYALQSGRLRNQIETRPASFPELTAEAIESFIRQIEISRKENNLSRKSA